MSDRVRAGDVLTADVLNRIVEAVLDRIHAGVGTSSIRTSGGVTLSTRAPSTIWFPAYIGIDEVTELPPIPTDRPRIVWWVSSARGGTGDNQLWAACPGQSRWTPLQNWTWLDGTPG